ncbi:hypothetical protein [Streptomyces goshikiensis]
MVVELKLTLGCGGKDKTPVAPDEPAATGPPHGDQAEPAPGLPPEPRGASGWLRALDHFAIFITAAGLAFFVMLSSLYDQFYRAFDLSAPLMGIGYADTLVRSWGFITCITVIALVLIPGLYWLLFRVNWISFIPALPWPFYPIQVTPLELEKARKTFFLLATVVFVATTLAIGMLFTMSGVDDRAERAKRGEPVRPIRFLGMLILDIYANRADKPTPVAGVEPTAVPSGPFLYLGNSDRSYVLYSAEPRRVVRLSTERFVLNVAP